MLWRIKHMNERYYILILSMLVGIMSGLVTVALKNTVAFVKDYLVFGLAKTYFNIWFFVYPLIGLSLVYFIKKYLIKRHRQDGVVSVLYAITKRKSIMKFKTVFTPVILNAITVGFGGSAGVEGPAIASNSAAGSQVGQWLRLNYKQTTLLLACGATGALSSSLNAPITGLVFALEVLMLDLTTFSIIPLLTAALSGALMTHFIYGGDFVFPVNIDMLYEFSDIKYFVLLGIAGGVVSIYFLKMFWFIEGRARSIQKSWVRFIVGGLLLGVIIFAIPPIFGEGYDSINYLLRGNYSRILDHSPLFAHGDKMSIILLMLLGMLIFKVIATAVTMTFGGVGGVIAPCLFIGATLGYVFSLTGNTLLENEPLNTALYTLLGMASILAGVLHAPLTAIFLIAELTGGYTLMLPLMLTVILSYLSTKAFVPHSMYHMQLARRKELITHHKDKAVLTMMTMKNIIENNFISVHPEASLGKLVEAVEKSKRNIFPVVNDDNILEGVVFLDDIRELIFKPHLYDEIFISQVMTHIPVYLRLEDDMETVMKKFDNSRAWNLPVVEKKGHYIGFLSKSSILTEYRRMLVELSEE